MTNDSGASALGKKTLVVLVVGQTPPPYHGQAMMIQHLLNIHSPKLKLVHVRMAFSESMGEVGRFQFSKIVHLLQVIFHILWAKFRFRATVLYYPPASPKRVPFYRDLAILLSCRWLFRRTIFHFHAAGLGEFLQKVNGIERWFGTLAYGKPSDSICMSELTRRDAEILNSRRTWIVPYGIPDESRHLSDDVSSNSNQLVLQVLYVGTVNRSKGILDVVEACGLLKRQGLNVFLKIVGSFQPAEFETELRQSIAKNQLDDWVQICGQLIGEEKHAAFAWADVFCFPSYYEAEGFPCVLLEAMSHGKAIVSTYWRGIPAMVDSDIGILVPINDPSAISEALKELLLNRERLHLLGNAARRKYLEHYTLERFQNRMLSIICNPDSNIETQVLEPNTDSVSDDWTPQHG